MWESARSLVRETTEKCVLAVIGLTFLIRCLIAWSFGLGYGESYHFSCAMHPSLSYFDHPPLSLLLASASMWATGDAGALAVRLPFVFLFAGSTWLLYLLGRRLFGPWPGFYAALLFNLSAVFTFSTGIFLQSDGPLVFFWLACVYCLTQIYFADDLKRPMFWWTAVGLTLGLALLSKYHAVFLVVGAGAFALFTPQQRRWVFHPGPYWAMLTAALVFSPVVIWNLQHDWISFLWQGSRGVQGREFRPDWLLQNIGGQALWLLPWIWFPLLLELPVSFHRGRADTRYRFIACMAVTPIALFTAVASYAPVGFHFHWQAPGYLILFLPLGATLHDRLEKGGKVSLWWLRSSIAFTAAAVLLFTTHAETGWWRQIGPKWLANHVGEAEDPTLESLDYEELPMALKEKGLLDDPNTFYFTNRWFQSGKVDYALGGRVPVLCLNDSDPRSWAFIESTDDFLGRNGVLVSTKRYLYDPAPLYGEYFEEIQPLGTVAIHRGQYPEIELQLHYCKSFRKPFPSPYR